MYMHICTYTIVIENNLHNLFIHITTNDENGSATGQGFRVRSRWALEAPQK